MEEPTAFEVLGDMPMHEPDPEGFSRLPPPDDPHGIAQETLWNLRTLIDDGNDLRLVDPQFRNRLVFSGAVAVLEAYLVDTIRNVVQKDRPPLVRLSTTNGEMQKEVLSVAMPGVKADPDILDQSIEDRLRAAIDANLRAVLYHNLATVIAIYRPAGNVGLTAGDEDRKKLSHYMKLRHDCVHRNGASPEGEKHTIFERKFVEEATERVDRTIDHVEDQITGAVPF
jgi:hypothetical protein